MGSISTQDADLCGCNCDKASIKRNRKLQDVIITKTPSDITDGNTPQCSVSSDLEVNKDSVSPLHCSIDIDDVLPSSCTLDEKTIHLFITNTDTETPHITPNDEQISNTKKSEDTIGAQYDSDHMELLEDSTDEESSLSITLDEHEGKKRESLKAYLRINSTDASVIKKSLYRKGTPHQWEDEDIEDLQIEMSVQFEALKQQTSHLELTHLIRSGSLSHNLGIKQSDDDSESDSYSEHMENVYNIYRGKSIEQIEMETDEVTRQIMHLAQLQLTMQ